MATHSGVVAWRIPWTEDIGGIQFMGPKDLDTIVQLLLSLFMISWQSHMQQNSCNGMKV